MFAQAARAPGSVSKGQATVRPIATLGLTPVGAEGSARGIGKEEDEEGEEEESVSVQKANRLWTMVSDLLLGW